ncbi:MAG: NAD(P)H-hydrate dehydratase [Peptostreptococcaceae bacterium]|nr:NAD(P)H-hydrate dehydratase [Peptostreptococcaceae bacterium]
MSMSKITALDEVKKLIPERKENAHKGDFGRVVIFAGSRRYTGAAYFCAQAAVRAGSGLVTLVTQEEVVDILASKLNEAMVVSQNSPIVFELLEKADVIAFGCGMENRDDTKRLLERILEIKELLIVLDADGINVLAGEAEKLRGRKNILLTPHEMEFARLIGEDVQKISSDREGTATRFAKEYGVNILLKGKNTIIASPEDYRINPTGSSKMASGGMGDALTGIIASLAGQGLSIYQAGYSGAFIHGYAADEKGKNMYSVTASDVIEFLPYAIYDIAQKP